MSAHRCGFCEGSPEHPICARCFDAFQRDFKRVAAERDAALAEVKRLRA